MVLVERKGRVLVLTLDRPDRGNSLDPPTIVQLRKTFLDAQDDPKIRVILLTGTGTRDFCTGIDVGVAKDFSATQKTNVANTAGDIATLIYYGKPTVVAINGRAMGMGIVFASAADYAFTVPGVSFQMPEVNVGVFPGASCISLWSRVLSGRWTRRILLGGHPFTPDDALAAGIVDEILPQDGLVEQAMEYAKKLSRKNPVLLKAIKWSAVYAKDLSYADGIRLETCLADWYAWEDPTRTFEALAKEFDLAYPLTGDPTSLLEEYERTNP